MSVDKKASMKRIIELTHSANQCGLKSLNGKRREKLQSGMVIEF